MYTPNAIGTQFNLCYTDAVAVADARRYFTRAIDCASYMEIPRLLVVADHPGFYISYSNAYDQFIDNMCYLANYADNRGVKLVIESLVPMESPIITTADDCVKALSDINCENVEAMLDIVPPIIAHEPISKYFEYLNDRLNYIHICKSDGKTDAHNQLTGEDQDFVNQLLTLFKSYNFNGYVTIELYSDSFWNPDLVVSKAKKILDLGMQNC